jgi:hypothetical protein
VRVYASNAPIKAGRQVPNVCPALPSVQTMEVERCT